MMGWVRLIWRLGKSLAYFARLARIREHAFLLRKKSQNESH